MTPQEIAKYRAVVRKNCEESFEFFARYFFRVMHKSKLKMVPHMQVLVSDLQDLHDGVITNLIVNMPPRYGKTQLCVILFGAWCVMKNPQCQSIHTSYGETLALENSSAVREVLRSLEFRVLWPEIELTTHKNGKGAWATVQGGSFLATSHGGQVTGFGAGRMDEWDGVNFKFSGLMLIDDPVKPDDYRHKPLREGANRRWTETLQSRRNSSRTPTLVIMQRVGSEDFTATLLANDSFTAPDGDPARFRHRKMPALIDEGLPTERALWPEKHSVEALKRMRDQRNERGEASPLAGETFSGQYQQEPTTIGGAIVKEHWWQHYSDRDEVVRLCTSFIITADTAYTEDKKNDPCSLQVWGFQGRRNAFLLDRAHGWWELPELEVQMVRLAERWPQAKEVFIEAKASGLSLAQTLRRKLRGRKMVPWKPKDWHFPDDKVARMHMWARQVHGGVVWLPSMDTEDPSYQPWVRAYVDEASAFNADDTHAHDDDCDGGNMACSVWVRRGGGLTDSSKDGTLAA